MRARDRDPGKRIVCNPFYVLGLDPDCSRTEVEREGQKLLAMLEVGLSGARTYHTPLGALERTPEKVREAMAELRDPDRRLSHELWARTRPVAQQAVSADPAPDGAPGDGIDATGEGDQAPWRDATALLGWRRR